MIVALNSAFVDVKIICISMNKNVARDTGRLTWKRNFFISTIEYSFNFAQVDS